MSRLSQVETISLDSKRPSSLISSIIVEDVPSNSLIHVDLIDARILVGEVLLGAIGSADPSMKCTLYPSAAAWLDAIRPGERNMVMLSVDRQPGRTQEDCLDDLNLLKRRSPDTPLIVVSSEEDPDAVCNALDIGVAGYISTSMNVRSVMQVIRLVQAGDRFIPAASLQALIRRPFKTVEEPAQESLLSPREVLVAKALRKGTPNKIIAYELNMCESTVKVHVRHIMKKLKAKNRTQVAFLTNSIFDQ